MPFQEPTVNWWWFHYLWTKKDTRTPANPLFWSGIWFSFRIWLYLELLGLLHTAKCTLTYPSLLCSGRSSIAYARVNHREHTNFPYPSQLEGNLLTVFSLFNSEIIQFVNFPKFQISIKCCIWYHRSWASLTVSQMRGKIVKRHSNFFS